MCVEGGFSQIWSHIPLKVQVNLKRYLCTNSRVETFNTFKAKHKVNLRKRGYSHKFINHFTNQVKFLDRSFELSKKKVTKWLHRIPFVTRFTPSASLALQIINKYWPHLQQLQQFKHIKIPCPMLSLKPTEILNYIWLNQN